MFQLSGMRIENPIEIARIKVREISYLRLIAPKV